MTVNVVTWSTKQQQAGFTFSVCLALNTQLIRFKKSYNLLLSKINNVQAFSTCCRLCAENSSRWHYAHIDVFQRCHGPVGVLQLCAQLRHTV